MSNGMAGAIFAMAGHGDHGIAHRHIGHPFAHRADDPGAFPARAERQRRFELIEVADDQRVGEVDTNCFHIDAHLPAARFRGWHIGHHQFFRVSVFHAQHRLHHITPRSVPAA
jgi:hypothetical protein